MEPYRPVEVMPGFDGGIFVASKTEVGVFWRVTYAGLDGLVQFYCTCPNGQNTDTVMGDTGCWHQRAAATYLVSKGIIAWDGNHWCVGMGFTPEPVSSANGIPLSVKLAGLGKGK